MEPLSLNAGVCFSRYIESRSIISIWIGNTGSEATPPDLDSVAIQDMVIDSLSCATTRGLLLGLRNANARTAMDHILKVFLRVVYAMTGFNVQLQIRCWTTRRWLHLRVFLTTHIHSDVYFLMFPDIPTPFQYLLYVKHHT